MVKEYEVLLINYALLGVQKKKMIYNCFHCKLRIFLSTGKTGKSEHSSAKSNVHFHSLRELIIYD